MDDKVRVLKLYERMNRIKIKTSDLIDSVESLEESLEKYLEINNKGYKKKAVNTQRSELKEVKNSVKYNIMSNLRNYL